ncbi:MAG: 3-phosphoserine/phosphohydroxythreonine transaminase [Phycisphaerales bacterium]|nr:3-phosphoserine/phosphohydroxythreonine transaminase [Phycisphaerales bacterium]
MMTNASTTSTTSLSTSSGTSPARPGAMGRVYNFSAGPACLPESVLQECARAMLDVDGTGMGILEHSHRNSWFMTRLESVEHSIRAVTGAGPEWRVLLMQGGASLHFNLLPLNFLRPTSQADYPDTDVWSAKAILQAKSMEAMGLTGHVRVPFKGAPCHYDHVPSADEMSLPPGAAYLHYCSNNTVHGTRFEQPPSSDAPLVCDSSSEMLGRPMDLNRHAMIYATAQKNLGVAGSVLVMIKKDFLETARRDLPSMLSYREFDTAGSMPNTPPTFGIFVMGLMAEWVLAQGGTQAIARANSEKSALLYAQIDGSSGFFRGLAQKHCRSHMNVSFKTTSPQLDKLFVDEADRVGMNGLTGHRDAGGIRASIYNAFPRAGCEMLAQFMREFARTRG